MVPNTGSDAKAWFWYVNATPAFAANHVNAQGTRIVDLEREDNGNLSFVSVKNIGNDKLRRGGRR